MRTAILVLNLIASLGSAVWGARALLQPASLSRSVHISSGEIFYVRMYAARAVPLGLVTAILPFYLGPPAVWVLLIAAAVQSADVAIALSRKDRGMAIGASLATVVHIFCGAAVTLA